MIHLITLLFCILSVEILIQLNFLSFLQLILNLTRKVTHILLESNISDHWKEKVIPSYALKIMKYCIRLLFILLLVLTLFFVLEYFMKDFLNFLITLMGIIEAVVFTLVYVLLRKSFVL